MNAGLKEINRLRHLALLVVGFFLIYRFSYLYLYISSRVFENVIAKRSRLILTWFCALLERAMTKANMSCHSFYSVNS